MNAYTSLHNFPYSLRNKKRSSQNTFEKTNHHHRRSVFSQPQTQQFNFFAYNRGCDRFYGFSIIFEKYIWRKQWRNKAQRQNFLWQEPRPYICKYVIKKSIKWIKIGLLILRVNNTQTTTTMFSGNTQNDPKTSLDTNTGRQIIAHQKRGCSTEIQCLSFGDINTPIQ